MPPVGEGQPPGAFSFSLNQTTQATLTWTPPAGGANHYLLQPVPLDGTPGSPVVLPDISTSLQQTAPPSGACYQLAAYQGAAFATSPVLCALPGFSTLAEPDGKAALHQPIARLAEVAWPPPG